MSFQNASDSFTTALHFIDTENPQNETMRHMAEGLREMAKGLKLLEKKVKGIEIDVMNFR